MAIILSVALLFLGIVVLVLIHVWVVSRAFRRGLQEFGIVSTDRASFGSTSMSRDDVEKLPSFDYKVNHNKDESNGFSPVVDCAVCLDRFQAGEKCRLLPLCRHSFHADCVDVWLLRAPVCPICRARADNITAIAIELRDHTIDNPVQGHDHLELELDLLQREGNPGLLSGIGNTEQSEQQVNHNLSGCRMEEGRQQESSESSLGNNLSETKIMVEGEGMVSRECP